MALSSPVEAIHSMSATTLPSTPSKAFLTHPGGIQTYSRGDGRVGLNYSLPTLDNANIAGAGGDAQGFGGLVC